MKRLGVGQDSFASIVRLVESELDVSMGRFLQSRPE